MLIAAARVVPATGGVLAPGYVAFEDGGITAIGAGPPPSRPDRELPDGYLLPGLVDLQVNGYFGVELGDAEPDGWATVARRLPQTGTTAFLPTLITGPIPQTVAALRRAAGFVPGLAGGARVLGIHLEGPFISPDRRGAHNPAWITTPDHDAIEALLSAGAGLVRVLTLAPEVDGATAAIKQLTGAGVLVSIGHSDATAAQVSGAAGLGARMVTHLFNAQRPLHHREPGVVGQALTDRRLTSGLIADLHHVAGPAAALAFAAAPGRIFLVTDAAACAGRPAGRYILGGQPIELADTNGTPPVRENGTLAGSALRMDAAVANMVAVGVSLADAVAAATRVPADLIARPDLGRLATGAAADLTWLNDEFRTQATWVAGQPAYRAGLR
ncbi:MAG: N-acetylglucosamine-6-phosphate deacetylase [Streptosporangiaceae bacterium]